MQDFSRYYWESWIEGFDYQRQKNLFDLSSLGNLLLMLVLVSVFIAGYFAYVILLPKLLNRAQQQPVQRIYIQLKNKLEKRGVRLSPEMSHREVFSQAVEQGIFDPQFLQQTFATYEQLRYSKHESAVSQQVKKLLSKSAH